MVAVAALIFASCATSLTFNVERPSDLDLNGAKAVSVLPFQTWAYSDTYMFGLISFDMSDKGPAENIARNLTYKMQEALLDSKYLDVVSSKAVERAMYFGDKNPCDVYLTGTLSNFRNEVKKVAHEQDDGTIKYGYKRYVSGKISYQIIDAKTQKIFAIRYLPLENSTYEYNSERQLPSAEEIVEPDLDRMVSQIMREIHPYTITKSVQLMKDPEKSPEMITATKAAKNGNYSQAENLFKDIYDRTGSVESGFNASRCMMAQGKLDESYALMMEIGRRYPGSKKVSVAISDLERELEYARHLSKQLDAMNLEK